MREHKVIERVTVLYPWDAMLIGDWFKVPNRVVKRSLQTMVYRAGAQRGKQFLIHVGEDGTLYVERTQ